MAGDAEFDLFVIGGGINGAAVARDAAGRGLSVAIAEQGDFAGATTSSSTKLLHGGLRYLEFRAFKLVRQALDERAVVMEAAPHLTHPLSFVIPRLPEGRPGWQVRAALWLYDRLGDRAGMPASESISLRSDRAGRGLDSAIKRAWRYSDGWIDDARMTIALVRDAQGRGATILARDRVESARWTNHLWEIRLRSGKSAKARQLVNATGPWSAGVAETVMGLDDPPALRLVQGAHIIVPRQTSADDALVIEQPDGRIVFVVPAGERHSLIGTTEVPFTGDPAECAARPEEITYLLLAANRVLAKPLGAEDICFSTAGVRPLVLDPAKDARETSREWLLHAHAGVGATTLVGGKITTHRIMAEQLVSQIFPDSTPWTRLGRLPGGDFVGNRTDVSNRRGFLAYLDTLVARHPHYDRAILQRLGRTFGRDAEDILAEGLGEDLGGVFEGEIRHMVRSEWAVTVDDIIWRRTKLALAIDSTTEQRIRWAVADFARQ